jgi:hypothetical protein
MLARNGLGLATAGTASEARKAVDIGKDDGRPSRPPNSRPQVRAELIGDDTCCAEGLTVRAHTPVLAMCRRLIETDYDPTTPLHCYRGKTLCLIVASIGEAARLEPNSKGTCFVQPLS